jgi:hypothetical protein
MLIVLSAWFFIFLIIMESVTGLAIIIFIITLLLFYLAYKKKRKAIRPVLLLLGVLIPATILFMMKKYLQEYKVSHPVEINLSDTTALGHAYIFDFKAKQYENGYPVFLYVCQDELKVEWNKRSKVPYDSLDARGQQIKYTLMRFLSSLGLRKDSAGVSKLSDKEIHSIEAGIANVNYQDRSMKARLMQILWEWDRFVTSGDASGHSVTQRLEFWKAAIDIIRENPVIGVGTGDMPEAYRVEYEKTSSQLSYEWRLRAHNQYLAIAVAFGLIGLACFIFALVFPFLSKGKFPGYFYCMFWIIAILSMFTEDTLETQPGATFFAFFSALFLFGMSSTPVRTNLSSTG